MLKLKYLFNNFELAKECIALYDYDEASISDMFKYFRISSNAVYPFRSGQDINRVCFLRISPSEEKSIKDVISEIHLINWLIDMGYPAMKPVAMRNGKIADAIDTKWGCYNVSCFAKVPGINLENVHGTLEVIRGYGECLGRLHRIVKTYPAREERRDHEELLSEIYSRLIKYKAPDYVFSEYSKVKKELSQLPINEENYGIVHYDFEPDNVFYDKDTGKFSVIDFDDSIRCWFALDIVRAIDSLDDIVDEDDLNNAKDAFIEGYRNMYAFTDETLYILPLMRRLVRLQEYSTILHVLSEPVNEKPEWIVELTKNLRSKLRFLEKHMC